jgi:hypothetical protein
MTTAPNTVQRMNRTVLLACAPFIGLMIWVLGANFSLTISEDAGPSRMPAAVPLLASVAEPVEAGLDQATTTAKEISVSIKKVSELYAKTNATMSAIMTTAKAQVNRPGLIYDRRITGRLGSPTDSVQSDKLGGSETTLAAVRRTGAVAGVNAGGFADSRGKRYPLSTTVVGGKYVTGFEASYNDLFFVGLNENLELIGGKFSSQAQLDKLKPKFGASFVPMLRKNGVNLPIPSKWQTDPYRAPRTVVANYKDDQLLFLVIDGRNENGSSGATLEEVQMLLTRFGAIDAYNLDGGGSSSLVFKGRIVNHPSDGQLRPLATNFLFFQ